MDYPISDENALQAAPTGDLTAAILSLLQSEDGLPSN